MGSIEESWIPPREGWVKLNTDGAANAVNKTAGCSELVRDVDGRWIGGFAKPLGCCYAFLVECWGALCGLNEVWKMGLGRILLESDSKALIQCLSGNNNHRNPIILAIRNLLV